MGRFFRLLFTSCLGTILGLLAISFLSLFLFSALASKAEQAKPIRPNSVLKLTFDQPIPEQTNNLVTDPFDLKNQKILGMDAILRTLEYARQENKIRGILLEPGYGLGVMGLSSARRLHDALEEFRNSGKFILSYSKFYSQGTYYLASPADRIYVNPAGGMDFHGFAVVLAYFKKMLDKVGMRMEVFYAGKYKSATEPFRRTDMSPENRQQLREYVEPLYQRYLTDLAEDRNLDAQSLRHLSDTLPLLLAEDMVAHRLADSVAHEDAVLNDLRYRLGLEKDEKINFLSLHDVYAHLPGTDFSIRDKVAVVFAEGTILDGKGDPGTIGDEKYVPLLRRLRKDKRVKALVLRVNSGGGSAMASENIYRELNRLRESGKPVVVSMGDYAASGGYYIACGGERIFAEPNTLTGSIGVFNMLVNARELLNDKMGITFDTVRTTRFSTGLTPFYDLSDDERRILQRTTDRIYERFLEVVAESRKMTRDEVHQIAQGRVWTGERALQIGLVDSLGTLEDAIASAARLADLEQYRISRYPVPKTPLQQFLEELTGEQASAQLRQIALRRELGKHYEDWQYLQELARLSGVQARMLLKVEFQ